MSYHEYKRGEQRLCVYCAKSALSIYHFALPGRADSAPNYRASYMWRQKPPIITKNTAALPPVLESPSIGC